MGGKSALRIECWILLVWLTGHLAAQTAPSAEPGRLLALEKAWDQAVQLKDGKALESVLSPELLYVNYDGTQMNRAQYMASVTAPSAHPQQIVSESMNVHFYGTTAVVNGVYREKGWKGSKPYVIRERFTDTWVVRGGIWMCVASISTLITP